MLWRPFYPLFCLHETDMSETNFIMLNRFLDLKNLYVATKIKDHHWSRRYTRCQELHPTQRAYDVKMTSFRRHFDVMCLLGIESVPLSLLGAPVAQYR